MTSLERAEWQVRQCRCDLAMAESQGQRAEVLQAWYDRYIAALHWLAVTMRPAWTSWNVNSRRAPTATCAVWDWPL
jgi:hypothetical protein